MSDAGHLFVKILRFLEVRPRSVHEVRARLERYGASPEEIIAIIEKLNSLHFLDDASFAEYLIDSRRARGRSSRLIALELSRHGFDRETISPLLSDPVADRTSIQKLIKQKSHLPREKLIAFLARRGFSWDLIKSALDKDQSIL